jgi:xylulokinase
VEYVLGIDVGTTGTKSALFSSDGTLIDIEYASYPLIYPREGWAEQNPLDWWRALSETTRAVLERTKSARSVVSLSLSTQGGCLVLLDNNFSPVCSAVSWMDKRAGEVSDRLVREISVSELYRTCGWPVMDSLNFPTILWYRWKRPDLLKEVEYFASTIDYLNYLLTGRFAIDYTSLALTGFLQLSTRGYSEKTMAIAGMTSRNLPEIVTSGKPIGRIRPEAAAGLGLSENVTVVSGAHDRYCESIGAGGVHTGDCVLGAGTSWVLLATSDALLFHRPAGSDRGFVRSIFPGLHPVEGRFGLMTVVPYGGNSLKWFRDSVRPCSSFEQLNDDASRAECGSKGLLCVPMSSSASGKGSFLNIDNIHTIGHFTRSVYEGVAFVNRIHFDLFREAGLRVEKLIMIGGGTKSGLWPHIVADVCNVPVELPLMQEAACAGAAVLAASGGNLFASVEEGSGCFRRKSPQVLPSEKNARIYGERFSEFVDFLGRV